MKTSSFLSILVFSALLAGCGKVGVSVDGGSGRTIQARGVSYVVPWETSNHDDTPAGFSYKGETVTIAEVGGQLTVDGKRYGTLKAGDTVSLLTKGTVVVNGTARPSL